MAFEVVVIQKEDGSEEKLSQEQFYAMTLLDRMHLLTKKKLMFFAAGKLLPASEALKK
jgi:hypothetical protein